MEIIRHKTFIQHCLSSSIDGETEVTDKILGAILRTLVKKTLRIGTYTLVMQSLHIIKALV